MMKPFYSVHDTERGRVLGESQGFEVIEEQEEAVQAEFAGVEGAVVLAQQ